MTGFLGDQLGNKLLKRGHKLGTLVRNVATSDRPLAPNTESMIRGEKRQGVSYYYGDLTDYLNTYDSLANFKPDVIIHLAAQTSVAYSFTHANEIFNVNFLGTVNMAEAARRALPKLKRFIFSGSVEEYGIQNNFPIKETAELRAASPYGVAKLFGHWMTINYREAYNMFACSGILFNHESPLRGEQFVTRKITIGLSKIKLGLQNCLELGNLDSKRDWGYAEDYVEAMFLMLQHHEPDNYVISTGETYSVKDFINAACDELNMDISWEGEGLNEVAIDQKNGQIIIKINPKYYRPTEVDILLGDSTKAKKILNWKPKTNFKDLVAKMIEYDYSKLKKE